MRLLCTASCRAAPRQLGRFESCDKRDFFGVAVLMRVLFSVCAVLLVAACQRSETPLWPPNVERTDVGPAEWMVGCFAVDPMTDLLRAAGAPEAFELTARRADVIEGRQRYRVAVNGSSKKYGAWEPLAPKKVRVQVGSPAVVMFLLSRSNDGLVGTYSLISDVSPGSSPEVPVSLRRVPCLSSPTK